MNLARQVKVTTPSAQQRSHKIQANVNISSVYIGAHRGSARDYLSTLLQLFQQA